MTTLSIDDLFTPANADAWLTTILDNANTLQLKTTSWEPGSPTLTIIDIVAQLMSQEDGLISLMAQAGFLDYAATGTVTYTAANGQTVTAAVTPDPSDPVANPTATLGWLDLLASSVYNVSRILSTYATGSLKVGNSSATTLVYAAGTYHVQNPDTGATYKNADAITIPQGTSVGGGITSVSNTAPIVVTTAGAHGVTSGDSLVLSDIVGIPVEGVYVVTVTSPTSFSLNGTDGTTMTPYVSGGVARTCSTITITADIAGTGGTSIAGAISEAVTSNTGVFVLNPADVIGSGCETNVALAARCRAKLASLSPGGPSGAYIYFALTASDILGNPLNPLYQAPAVVIPQVTRAEKFADINSGVVTTVVASASGAISGVTNLGVAAATNTSPIQITTTGPHGLSTNDPATITGVLGASGANGQWTITVVDGTNFTLNGSSAGGVYTGGGVVEGGALGQIDRVIQAHAVPDTVVAFTQSATTFNVAVVATVVVPASLVAAYTAAVQTALALYFAAIRIGGGDDGFVRYNDVIGVLFTAGIANNQPSYVRNITGLTLNAVAADLAFPASTAVATLSPTPTINVVGA